MSSPAAARCLGCGRPLEPIDLSSAGPLAKRVAASVVCDKCAGSENDREQLINERRRRSTIPNALASEDFSELAQTHKPLAVEAAQQWAQGDLPLLTLFGKGELLPDRLAACVGLQRLQREYVRWVSASDHDALQVLAKNSRVPLILADVEQGALQRRHLGEVFEIVSWRQRNQLPLLVTSNVAPQSLAKSCGEPFVRLLRRGKAIMINPDSEAR